MALFQYGAPEEFLLFMQNFNMNLAESGILATVAEIQYLRTIICWEVLRQFYLLHADV